MEKLKSYSSISNKELIPSEYNEQVIIFKWASMNEVKYPCLKYLYSTLNGVRLPMGLAVKAKNAGNKKGVPDIILPYKNNKYSGLYIELKRIKRGVVSPEQKEWINYLNTQGYKAIICKGSEIAIKEIQNYIKDV